VDSDPNSISRRTLLARLGAGFTGAAITSALPAKGQTADDRTGAPFVDPTRKYPKPPYPGQSQPWPGLASKMNPRLASIHVQLAANDASYTTGNIYGAGGGAG
jgi:hypothetical protein